jgi:hypothetical protein
MLFMSRRDQFDIRLMNIHIIFVANKKKQNFPSLSLSSVLNAIFVFCAFFFHAMNACMKRTRQKYTTRNGQENCCQAVTIMTISKLIAECYNQKCPLSQKTNTEWMTKMKILFPVFIYLFIYLFFFLYLD